MKKNDRIYIKNKDQLSEKALYRAVEKALWDMGREYRNSKKESISFVNIREMAKFAESVNVLRAESQKNDTELEICEYEKSTNSCSISVKGRRIVYRDTVRAVCAFTNASNFNAFVNEDGSVQIDMVFYGIAQDI